MQDHYSYLKSFSIIHRFSITYHLRALKDFHLSGHQMGYIMLIYTKPGISQENLSAFLGLNKGAVAKGIRPLVEEGFVRRIPSPTDRRAYELYLTEKTEAICEKAEQIANDFENIITRGMTESEQEIFKRLLLKAADNAQALSANDKDHCGGRGPLTPGPRPGRRPQRRPHDHRDRYSEERGFTI